MRVKISAAGRVTACWAAPTPENYRSRHELRRQTGPPTHSYHRVPDPRIPVDAGFQERLTIYISASTVFDFVDLFNVTISGNSAFRAGGLNLFGGGFFDLVNVTVADNTASVVSGIIGDTTVRLNYFRQGSLKTRAAAT